MIAVAVASEKLIATLDENRARLAKLADPRTINMNDAEAERLVAQTDADLLHHRHDPFARNRRAHGADGTRLSAGGRRQRLHQVHSRKRDHADHADGRSGRPRSHGGHLSAGTWRIRASSGPTLVYWGHYVAHDNNRDAMGLTLTLTRNVLNTFVGLKAQVLHDLHESEPYLYDNTVGDGPYNAWIDPMLADEWQMMGWNNVSEMTKFGMPGVFTHGTFDTWSPSYLMFIAATHNGISRLYETFGNGGADTEERTLRPNEYARTWYKQNPPLPKAKWSQRNNNNYEETGLLTALALFLGEQQAVPAQFLSESQALDRKAEDGRPGGVRFPGRRSASRRAGRSAAHAAGAGLRNFESDRGVHGDDAGEEGSARGGRGGRGGGGAATATQQPTEPTAQQRAAAPEKPKPEPRTFPAGTYIVRMDQPYSRIADTLLDYQYWAANDPQKSIYDDTGWTFGELSNVQVARVTDGRC